MISTGENDVGKNGVNPHILAQEIVTKIKDDVLIGQNMT